MPSDGTWSDSRQPDELRDVKKDTTVHRFPALYASNDPRVHYLDGVGGRFWMMGKLVWGLIGAAAENRIAEQFELLQQNVKAGDLNVELLGTAEGRPSLACLCTASKRSTTCSFRRARL